MGRHVTHYTDDPAVMALDVKEYLVGQRNILENALIRNGAEIEKWQAVKDEPQMFVDGRIRAIRKDSARVGEQYRLVERRITDMDAIHAALTKVTA